MTRFDLVIYDEPGSVPAEQTLGGPLAELLAEMIPRAARAGHRRFPLVPADDFEQVMWERILINPTRFRQLLDRGSSGQDIIWTELSHAATRLGSEDDRYRRALKAARAGYSPDDEQFYSAGMLRHLVPVLIEAEWEPANAIERATSGTDAAGVRIHGSDPASAAETYMVILIDVVQAFRRLRPYQQKLLTDYYGLSQEDTEDGRWERESYASSQGMTLKAFQNRAYRSLDALERQLGGRNPWLREEPAKSA